MDKKTYKEVIDEYELTQRKPANITFYIDNFVDEENKSILVPFSDIHVGNEYFKQKEFEANIEWAYDMPNVIIALNGDLIESKTKSRKGDGVFTQWNPQKQIDYVMKMFKPFADNKRIVAMTNGNHEDAITLETGVDITALFAKEFNVPYLKNGGFMTIKVDSQKYIFYMTHGSSGATLPYTKGKAARDLSTFIEGVDCCLYGHVHAKEDATQEIYLPSKDGKRIETKTMHYVLTGHYLDYLNSYAQMKSMRPSATGTPKIKMQGDYKQLRVSL